MHDDRATTPPSREPAPATSKPRIGRSSPGLGLRTVSSLLLPRTILVLVIATAIGLVRPGRGRRPRE